MYREDLEAALARAEAAERELAEQRAADATDRERLAKLTEELSAAKTELARLRKAAGKQPPAARVLGRMRMERPGLKTLGAVGGVLVAGGMIFALIFGPRACGRNRVLKGPGELYAAHIMRTKAGEPRLIVVSEAMNMRNSDYDGTLWRVDLVDPATGKRLVRKVFNESGRRQRPELLPAGPGRFWCDLGGSFVGKRQLIELCDVDTLEVVVSRDQLIARNPALKSGFANSAEIDLSSGDLVVTTKTAETLIIDAETLAGRPFHTSHDTVCVDSYQGGGQVVRARLEAAYAALPAAAGKLAFYEGPNCSTVRESGDPAVPELLRALPRLDTLGQSQEGTTTSFRGVGTGDVSFEAVEGGPRQGLFREVQGRQASQIGSATFIHPELLTEYGAERRALRVGDAGVILVHKDSLDNNAAQLLISHLGLSDGALGWTLTQPAGEVMMGYRLGDVVLVAIRVYDKQSFVLGIDWKTGAERWRYAM